MSRKTSNLLFKNCTVWTGNVGSAGPREVLVKGRRIAVVDRRIENG